MSAGSHKQFFRPDVRRDVDDEIAAHLDMRAREFVERGVLPGEARDLATRRFGNPAAIARECRAIDEAWYREQRRASMWRDLRQDIRYALGQMRRAPAFTAVAILTLAVGLGATTAIFTLANWALLRPLPGIERQQDVQQVWTGRWRGKAFGPSFLSYPNLADVASRLQTISIAGTQGGSFVVGREPESARPVVGQFVTASYFDLLGVRMRAGRPFTAAEDNPSSPSQLAVVSEQYAIATFGGPEAAIGQQLRVNGVPATIVGVSGRGFAGLDRMRAVDVWLPGAATPIFQHMGKVRYDDRRTGGFYDLVVRLKPGATWPQVDAELASMGAWLASEYPKENSRFSSGTAFHRLGGIGGNPLGRKELTTTTLLMMGVSALVLLIACSNVASLLMMKGVGRSGEVAVRKALGASRFRLLRQHLTEGISIWLLGGTLAVVVVWWILRAADGAALLGMRAGPAEGVPVDWRVMVFAAGLSLAVGALFSVAPALRAMRVEAAEILRQENASASPRRLRVGTTLTVIQLALSFTLAVGALLMSSTIRELGAVDPGFDPRGVYTFSVRPSSIGYSPEQTLAYREEFQRQLALVPGVDEVAIATRAPFVGVTMGTRVRRFGETTAPIEMESVEVATANFFDALRIPLRRGRVFTPEEVGPSGSRPVVMVSESLARQLFGNENPIGRSVEFRTIDQAGQAYEIIGVVGDARYQSLTEAAPLMAYQPAEARVVARGFTFVVRAAPGAEVPAAVRRIATALNPSLPVNLPMSVSEGIARSRAEWDVLSNLMTGLASIAGVLAAVGLYAVVAFGVAARRREFGIRLALGAAPSTVMALVFRRTILMTAIGLVLGLGGAVVLARVLSSRLFGVTPYDPMVWTLSALTLITLAIAASWLPARRAVSVDVTRSLRAL